MDTHYKTINSSQQLKLENMLAEINELKNQLKEYHDLTYLGIISFGRYNDNELLVNISLDKYEYYFSMFDNTNVDNNAHIERFYVNDKNELMVKNITFETFYRKLLMIIELLRKKLNNLKKVFDN